MTKDEALEWMDRLVHDLKLQLLGEKPHEPITLERLQEWKITVSTFQIRKKVEKPKRDWKAYRAGQKLKKGKD